MAAALPYALLGAGGLTAADLALIEAGNQMDGESQMSGSDKVQAVLAALGGLAMGGAAGMGRSRRLLVEKDAEGNVRISVPGAQIPDPWGDSATVPQVRP